MCSLLACPSGTEACFDQENTLYAGGLFDSVEIQATGMDRNWTFFRQGMQSGGDTMFAPDLSSSSSSKDGFLRFTNETLHRPLVSLLLFGLDEND